MTYREESGDGWTLRLGDYREVLADVECDAVITDPPYSERTHSGQRHGRRDARYANASLALSGLPYEHWTQDDVLVFCEWASRTSGWVCPMMSHDLVYRYTRELEALGRYVFAPLACVQINRNVRLAGDGPASWSDYLLPTRPRGADANKWGALPGAYVGKPWDDGENTFDRSKRVTGGKPLWLMRAIVRDYSRPGDLVCDPCAGGGTTLLAAVTEGRRAIGAEIDPATFELAVARLRKGHTRSLFEPLHIEAQDAEQVDLFRGEE